MVMKDLAASETKERA